ncbi:MAG: DEAD/DEAH box helicase [Candidatus Daviesbacteria bacterium]|nr:DEAD/DEAH box helicase [Candidatus Daviesbacteria bacterium]
MYQNRYNSNRSNNRPSYGGSSRYPRRQNSGYGNQARKSSLGNNISLFIKKAEPLMEEVGENVTHTSFNDFEIIDALKQNILAKGYDVPTPIQDQAIDPILEGRDLIGLANTGTGKTAAFLIPLINKIYKDRTQGALIVVPTRELAVQILEEFRSLTLDMKISSALAIGGSNLERQIRDVKRVPHVVIGTPGRLKDLIERRALDLSDYSTFILDEVDLMVDIGFIADVKYFVSLLPEVRQSLFFSATISPKIQEIIRIFVNDPVTISVKTTDTSKNIDQDVVLVENGAKKIEQLHDLLIKDGFDKVLIFGRTKRGVETLNRELETRGFRVGAIHGNKTQGYRQRILQSFKQDEIQILLATDVAARGLDIPNVSHVINYELPETYEDYIHRIGRTGRAGKVGSALTFVSR